MKKTRVTKKNLMESENAAMIAALLVGLILFVAAYIWIERPFHTPKFKAGDCVAYWNEEKEFIPAHADKYPDTVAKVGKSDYLLETDYPSLGPTYRSTRIKYVDDSYVQVPCEAKK